MKIIAGCIIEKDNKILMVKEAKKKCYGQWNFPAGHKVFHPDLYEKYAFEANIDVLCRLQLSRDLPEQFEEEIKSAQAMLKESVTKIMLSLTNDK